MATESKTNSIGSSAETEKRTSVEKSIPENIVQAVLEHTKASKDALEEVEYILTPEERRRLIGVRAKNLGFIYAAYQSAITHLDLVPPWVNLNKWQDDEKDFDAKQRMFSEIEELMKIVGDLFFLSSNVLYNDALEYYNALRDASKAKVPAAMIEYAALKTFFHKTKSTNKLSKEEVERDVAQLLSGKKDGKIVIENTAPTTASGKLTVTDDIETKKDVSKTDIK
ncbi:MAG: hypothetical protein LBS54_03440 [Dysgonamonadaceae bacterium]|jgi:hypothetical protein|nr:hypothetical protein [Dysgonamonadaceae bacterium]